MPKIQPRYIVEGRGHFPFDMLRYDVPEFVDATDVWHKDDVRRAVRQVVLRRTPRSPDTAPCIERWLSFGWTVLADEARDKDHFQVVLERLMQTRGEVASAAAQPGEPQPKQFTEFLGLHAVLQETYDLNGLGTVLNEMGADTTFNVPPPGANPADGSRVTGYELVRRMDLAHKRLRTLRRAIENTQAILDRGVLGKMQ